MKVTCPNNPKHKRFCTTAHVMQDWVIDNNANWIRTLDESVQTVHGPTKGNCFTCMAKGCGAEAIVEDE